MLSSTSQDLRQFERLLAQLSARFINLASSEVDAAITDALRRIVEILGVDRSQLIRLPPLQLEAEITHSWAMEGVPSVPPKSVADNFPWGIMRLRAGHAMVIPRLDDLPPEAAVDKASFQRAGVKSNLTMPMSVAGRVEGAIAFGCLRHFHAWPDDLVEQVGFLAQVFANALAHKRAQEALDVAMNFERTVSAVLTALLTAGHSEQDRTIEAGLRDIAKFLGAERATLWERVEGKIAFAKTHRWLAESVTVPNESVDATALPWTSVQLVAGSIVRFARHSDLPPEAATDLSELQAQRVRAAVIVPLEVSGVVVGALSIATAHEDRDWPDTIFSRVKFVGEIFASVLARRDSERREQDAQARAAHAARVGTMGVLAASLVHELTQPLAASLANAESALELLAAPSPDLDKVREAVADILADDRRAGELIQQLRHFLRRGDTEKIELDLLDVVIEVLRVIGTEATKKGIVVDLDFEQPLTKFVGNRVQIQQVVMNLVLNGFDAVAEMELSSRRVVLHARSTSTGVTFAVTDSGRGMDESMLARIFQPFFTTKPGGMGLGLSIAQTIAVAHGGTLSVRSAPGEGTTFRMELPTGTPRATTPAQTSTARAGVNAGTVFIVDDDPSMRRALDRQLRSAGYRVETFASAQAYLDQAPQTGIACIVSDMRMPGLSGLDLQATLTRSKTDLPMVFISGHGDIATSVYVMKAGAVSYLAKPFTKDELLAAVSEALARSSTLDRNRREGAQLEARYLSLTPREREVFTLVSTGLFNKVIADRLGVAESTIKIHRGRVMEKMGAASVAELVKMAERLAKPSLESLPT